MNLPAIFQQDTAAKLEAAHAAASSCAARIAELSEQRQAVIEGQGDLAEAIALEHQLAGERLLQGLIGERIAFLETQVVSETVARRERWRVAGIAIT